MAKKYELLTDRTMEVNKHTLYRIKALINITEMDVTTGDIGGWIEKEENLSHHGLCWVAGNAQVYDNAVIACDSLVDDEAVVCDNSHIYDDAQIKGNAKIYGNSNIYGSAVVEGECKVYNTNIGEENHLMGNLVIGTITNCIRR